jgi:hypothetical protein
MSFVAGHTAEGGHPYSGQGHLPDQDQGRPQRQEAGGRGQGHHLPQRGIYPNSPFY